jgi:hypothetical protein
MIATSLLGLPLADADCALGDYPHRHHSRHFTVGANSLHIKESSSKYRKCFIFINSSRALFCPFVFNKPSRAIFIFNIFLCQWLLPDFDERVGELPHLL